MTSAPALLLRSSATFVLYCSSSTPEGWKVSVTLTPLAFCCFVKVGMTYLAYQSASSAFLPPAMELDVMVSVTSLAPAFWVGLVPVEELRSQAAAPTSAREVAAAASTRRRTPCRRTPWVEVGFIGWAPSLGVVEGWCEEVEDGGWARVRRAARPSREPGPARGSDA